MKINKKTTVFIGLFIVLGLIALQFKLSNLAGSKVSFTGFDFFSPSAGAFLGPIGGAVSVLFTQVINFFIHGSAAADLGTWVRFIPPVFAAIYFGKKTKLNIWIPLAAIISFNLDPVGRQVWYYSLFWLIPVICYFWQERFLFAKSLGAAFMAHAVGGAIWVHLFHLPEAVWVSLIPVVAMERLVFALGIAATYVVMDNLVNILTEKKVIPAGLQISPKYLLHGKINFKTHL